MSLIVGLRDSLARFANRCELVLRANDHKGGWHDLSAKQLLRRLAQETKELESAIERRLTPKQVSDEAADVANFCMMIAENYRVQYIERVKRGEVLR